MTNDTDIKMGKLGGGGGCAQTLTKALAAALLLPITVVCTALTIYFGNASELGIDLPSVLRITSVFLVLTTLVLFICQLPFVYLFKGKCFVFVNAFLVMAGCWFWCQANVFNWNMGVPGLDVINFEDFAWADKLEKCVWLCSAACTLCFCRGIHQYTTQVSAIVIATQLVVLFPSFFKGINEGSNVLKPNFSQYESTFSGLFNYSEKTDVYLVILDSLGQTIFDDIAKKNPYYATFKDFTYFQNHFTPPPEATQWSIPRIFTGSEEFREGIIDFKNTPELRSFFAEAYLTPTIFDELTSHGYECRVQTFAPKTIYWKPERVQNIRPISRVTIGLSQIISSDTFARTSRLIGYTLFRLTPIALKDRLFSVNAEGVFQLDHKILDRSEDSFMPMYFSLNDIEFFTKAQNVQWKSSNNPQLKYIHLHGNHFPYYMDENIKSLENVLENYGNDNLLERHRLESNQARGTLKIVQWLLMEMKKRDTYDNSLIIVMSDHGAYMAEDIVLDKAAKNKPLLLVKRPGDKHDTMQTNDNPTCVSDTKNAILTELDLPRPDDAFSWFNVPQELAEKRNAEWSAYLEKKSKETITP